MNWPIVRVRCVIEGHGEVDAVPVLIRRIAHDLHVAADVPHPIRIPRSKLVKADELTRAVELAVGNLRGPGGVFVLIDADDDCPRELAPQMLQTAQAVRPDVPMSVVFAKVEFEAWFLAGAPSLAGHSGLDNNLVGPQQPESIHDAKGWLTEHMQPGHTYSETLDQAALTRVLDLNAVRNSSDSFDKCYRDLSRLLTP